MFLYQKYRKLPYHQNCLSALETWLFWEITELYPNYKNQPPKFQQLLTRAIVTINQNKCNINIGMVNVSVLRNSLENQLRK